MRVVNVEGGHSNAIFQMRTFGMPSRETFDYLEQMSAGFDQNLTDSARMHFQEVSQFYQTINYDDALAALRSLDTGLESLEIPNRIQMLDSIESLQQAPDVMIPWLMANPMAREMYNHNQIEGYQGRFDDMYGDLLGDTTPLYQAAVNGVRREVNGEWIMETFPDVDLEKHMQLDMVDQVDILNSWTVMEDYLELGDRDPTSQFNGKM